MSTWGKDKPANEDHKSAEAENIVNQQTSASVAQANLAVLSGGPAYAVCQSGLALSQSQSVLFANMVANQYHQAVANNASVAKGVKILLDSNETHMNVDLLSLLNFYKSHPDDTDGELAVY
jgi:hypothetical protein